MRVLPWLIIALLPGAAAQFTTEDLTIASHDGTNLNARLYTPETTPAPAILLTHGWGENIDYTNPTTFAERYAEEGYVVLSYDSRGWGGSEGQVELNGPNEVKDAQALIDYLAGLDSVILDGPGDPRLGMVGQSYAGGTQILTAQEDPRIDAIAPFSTWSNLLHSLGPDDVVKRGWVDLLFASGETGAAGIPLGGRDPEHYHPDSGVMSPDLARWYAAIQANNAPDDEVREELGVIRSLSPTATLPPTFLGQGWPDTLFPAEDALMTFQHVRARSVDARLHLFDMGHGGFGNYATDETVMAHLDSFMAQHLREEAPTLPPYPVVRYRYAEDDYVGEVTWPPVGTSWEILYVTDDGLASAPGGLDQTLITPPIPAQCTEISNFQSETGEQCGQGVDGTFRTFAAPPFDEATEVTGTPQLVMPFTSEMSEVFLFFQVVDIAPDGSESSVLAQVKPTRVAPDAGQVFLDLHTITHHFEAGHAIGVKIATTDITYMGSREPGEVTLTGNALVAFPLVPKDAHGDMTAPSVQRGYLPGTGDNRTETLRVTLRDNLALGPHTLDGPVTNVTIESESARERTLLIDVEGACGQEQLTVSVVDLVGLDANRTFDVVPCPDIEPTVVPEAKEKDSPMGFLIVPVLAALLLRRRV